MVKKISIEDSWHILLKEEFGKTYFSDMRQFIRQEYKHKTIYPQGKNIFNAFNLTPVYKVKAVILGQDPYHGPNQAHGLCFSVMNEVQIPPSLKNIYKEINDDLSLDYIPKTGFLESWAKQGVFLLNSVLTVEQGKPNSHKDSGWEIFTDRVIEKLSNSMDNLVFLLWGRYAQCKESLIDKEKHLILKAAHPSPLSAYNGFFGCKHFSKTNNYLINNNKEPINWKIL